MSRILASLALTLAVLGGASLAWVDRGLSTQDTVIDGVPLTIVRSATVTAGAVVAHGFGGSARLMRPFADTLARHGFAVVLLDFAGHGRNTHPWHDTESLSTDLDVAVGYLRSLPGVERTVLVGHSMGAAAVTSYAASHPGIAATVAISLPVKPGALPHRLLLLVGGLEFAQFRDTAAESAQGSDPGDRRAVVVPGVEHVSILYARQTHTEMLTWLGAGPRPSPTPERRILGGVLLLLAFAAGLYPLARLLFGLRLTLAPCAVATAGEAGPLASAASPSQVATPSQVTPPNQVATPNQAGRPSEAGVARGLVEAPPVWMTAIAVAACVVAVPVAWLMPDPLPIAVTGYVTIFALAAGAIMLFAARRLSWPGVPRKTMASLILLAYAIAAIVVPLHLGLTHLLPAGPRWWLLPIVAGAFTAFAWGNLRLSGARLGRQLIGCAAVVVVLGVATMIGLAPGFLLLVLPLLAILLAYQAVWIAVLRRFAVPAWLMAVTGAVLPALPALASMPLI